MTLPVDVQEARVAFTFKNESRAPIRIVEVRTECDCVQASFPALEIQPGKEGEVALSFHLKLRNGTETVRADVVTDNGETCPISVSAKLRSFIEIRPLTLVWRRGEKRDAKEFIVSSTGLGKLRFTKVAPVKDSKVEIWPGNEPETIRVLVTPPAGDLPFRDLLVVSAMVEGTNETKVYDLHVSAD